MKEDFLHLLWQQQLYARDLARLTDGQPLIVLKPGFRNSNSGPDFEQSKVLIDNLEWIGSVEIHVKASEWNQHGHTLDPAYQSVVLHVVWEKDIDVYRMDGTRVPTFELKDKVPLEIILRYRELMSPGPKAIACQAFFPDLDFIRIAFMQERALVERLERKSKDIVQRFYLSQKEWQETFYQSLAHTLGLKINAEPMLMLAQSIPTKILAALGWKTLRILPLFLGQSGFLEEVQGFAGNHYRKEYDFLLQKYGLTQHPLAWKKFRIRPGSFPIKRVILLAQLIPVLPIWFRMITEVENPKDFFSLPDLAFEDTGILGDFLQENGYKPDQTILTTFLKESLVINLFSPFLTTLGLHKNNPILIEKATTWLHALPPEPNAISRMWGEFGLIATTAGQTQALNEIYNQYCLPKRCMDCAIGSHILGNKPKKRTT